MAGARAAVNCLYRANVPARKDLGQGPPAPLVSGPPAATGAAETLQAALALNTRRGYRSAWQAFTTRADAAGVATLRMASAAVTAADDAMGRPSPCAGQVVRQALRGMAR
ncbi:MAG: hypothetical protein F4149_12480 [Gammaproteobacteria bacterium]|nr:hypothetical protein [Gammaproteobacteria bacterium]MYK83825.1 hypothetical protein [Gammaproteobacteria bacterium]